MANDAWRMEVRRDLPVTVRRLLRYRLSVGSRRVTSPDQSQLMTTARLRSMVLAGAVLVATPLLLHAQTAPQPTFPQLEFSGVMFGNFQYRTDNRAKNFNKFDIERVYLNFRVALNERTRIRATTDIYQQQNSPQDAYYLGWAVRFKYAFVQYDYYQSPNLNARATFGMAQTLIIDYDEQYWARWISTDPIERAGLMSSSDLGVVTSVALPNRWGELYATYMNGPGYQSREMDRFKDPAARLAITPFGRSKTPLLSTLAIVPWAYKGTVASRFVNGGVGQVGAVGSGLDRDRWGIFVGARDPRLTLGAHYAGFRGEGENGNNTLASPRVVFDTTGQLLSVYGLAKPLVLLDTAWNKLGIVGRYDRVVTNTATDARYHVFIGGLTWDVARRFTVSANYQEQLSDQGTLVGTTVVPATLPLKTWFFQFVATY